MKRRVKIILSLGSILLAMALLSITMGRDLINGEEPSLVSFGIINFAGYLFMILLPVESLVPVYQALGYNGFLLGLIAVSTAILAQPINYAVGYMMSSEVIKGLIGEKKYNKMERYIQNYGKVAVFFFNVTPLSSSVLSLVAGMLRFRFRSLMLYSLIGLVIKYLALIYLFGLFF
ncbi:VTT domain-containing protein [Candidatus Woesearchaeota archaeon]|nr:VTT domain-containing protein [Candidatus Woesearchaeota archaeon]